MSKVVVESSKLQNEIFADDDDVDVKDNESINLVSLNQRYVCFDVEQLTNAKQELKLRRNRGVQYNIAWRMRTNVPTRYLVNPSRGFIQNDDPVTLSIELVKNKFHPSHKLTLQAVALIGEYDEKTIWKHQKAKNWNEVQMIRLKLSTVLIHIEMSKYEVANFIRFDLIYGLLDKKIIAHPTSELEHIQKLEELADSLQTDASDFRKNTERTMRLKAILEQALDTRRVF
uniref:Major sperm protein n=1 Tax=Setaria digitata TaxID=48799 RepID=A0A915PZ42_9BILA